VLVVDCNVFKKRLYDYLEDNITHDMKSAMEKHMEECENCREIYNREKEIDEEFRSVFNIDGIDFSSSRADIMKKIDRNRYSKSKTNKLMFFIKKNRYKYMSAVAAAAVLLIFVPIVARNSKGNNYLKGTMDSAMSTELVQKRALKKVKTYKSKTSILSTDKNSIMEEKSNNAINDIKSYSGSVKGVYIPKFDIRKASKKEIEKNITTWKNSPNNKFSACIDGMDIRNVDLGIHDIYIKNLQSGNVNVYSIKDNKEQNTPMYLEWWDDNNILVIIGFGYGTVSKGGNVYDLNINTGETRIVYNTKTKEQVCKVTKRGKDLYLDVIVYDDDAMNEYHIEKGVIKGYKVDTQK